MPAVALTAAISTGAATGSSRMGSRTSLARVWAVIADRIVPTPAKPTVPRKITRIRPGSNRLTPKKALNTGNISASTTSMNRTVEIILPK